MAVIPQICITYESDASLIYVKDETGEYVLSTNEGGYGAPNGDRLDYAGVLTVYYQPFEGSKSLLNDVASVNSAYVDYNAAYANTIESSFQLSYFKDGWYEFYYTLVPISATPAVNTIIYSVANSRLEQYNSSLVLVPVFDETTLQSTALYELASHKTLKVIKLKNKIGELGLAHFECKQCIECGCKNEFDILNHLREGVRGAENQFNIAPFEGQRQIEKLTKQFKIV